MGSLYEISSDIKGLYDLVEGLVDEDGNPREPTEEEMNTIREWFKVSEAEFTRKFDSYCKYIKNLKMQAENVEAERKIHKDEMDRLSKRAKSFETRSKSLQSMLQWCMDNLKMKKFKSDLFSAGIQAAQMQVGAIEGAKLKDVPEEYLKPRELDTTAIKQAIKDGILVKGEDIPNHSPLDVTKIFDAKTGKVIPEIYWHKGEILVIR